MVLNFAHLHLLLNHVPTVGAALALGILILAFVRRNDHLKHAGLEVLVVIALLTLPAYLTGAAAHRELRGRTDLSDVTIRLHQDAALAGFAVTEIAGFAAWIALWQWRRKGRAARGMVPAATALLFVALALMGRAANIGGEIGHPEIRPAVAAGAAEPQFVATAIGEVMVNSRWVWPASEALHFLGLALTFGVLLAVNLRILGVMRQVPFADLHRLLPWGMLGFGVNLVTGMMFFVGTPQQYVQNGPFYWKVALLMFAGANFLYLTVFKRPWAAEGWTASPGDKAMAISSMAAWLGVMYAGRMLPFLGNAF